KSHERVIGVESEEDPKEDPQEDPKDEVEPTKKRLKDASKSKSNTLPPNYTTPNEETKTDLDSTTRCEAKPKELENTCESSVRSKPYSPQTIHAYMRSGTFSDDANPNISTIIAQQLHNIILQIVTQVINNFNNANAIGNGNGENGSNHDGCTYKDFLDCKPRDLDGNGGAISLTQWIEKMDVPTSSCVNNQKGKYAASSLINKALTWWNTQIQARGRESAL
nr:reverse transcriptase domain-containing protein [Tanacetum cinerariifolium]